MITEEDFKVGLVVRHSETGTTWEVVKLLEDAYVGVCLPGDSAVYDYPIVSFLLGAAGWDIVDQGHEYDPNKPDGWWTNE